VTCRCCWVLTETTRKNRTGSVSVSLLCILLFSTHTLLMSNGLWIPWLLGSIYIDLVSELFNDSEDTSISSMIGCFLFLRWRAPPHSNLVCSDDEPFRPCMIDVDLFLHVGILQSSLKEMDFSFGDRIILMNSVVISCPTCMLSFYKSLVEPSRLDCFKSGMTRE
jgi:hypothetical protein